MSLNRNEKAAVVEEVQKLAANAQTLVMADYRGVTVGNMTELRAKAREQGVTLRVLKNTLVRRAIAGTPFEVVSDQLVGSLIYSFSEDAVAAAKVLADFAKTTPVLELKFGVYNGKALNVDEVKELANIPSKEVLLAQLLGLMQSPVSSLARALAAVAAQKEAAA